MKDFYYILGTDENCTTLEIKEAYRKLSKKFHPDLNFNDKYFEKHFREIKEAYETLIDPDKRSVYDKKLRKFKAEPAYDQYAEDLRHREEELRRREEKIRFRQAYPHYYRSRKAPGKDKANAAPVTPGTRSRIRKVDMAFTLVLVVITIIFGNYVMRVIHDTKPVKIINNAAPVVADVPFQPVKHKRKHKLKAILSDNPPEVNNPKPAEKVIADDYRSAVAETKAEEKAQAQKPPVIIDDENASPSSPDNTPDQPLAVSYKTPAAGSKFLYATNIISNATGVTNLRKTDHYNSDIIKEIPTNSKVLVIQKGDIFYKVLCDNSTGYVPKWALETR